MKKLKARFGTLAAVRFVLSETATITSHNRQKEIERSEAIINMINRRPEIMWSRSKLEQIIDYINSIDEDTDEYTNSIGA